VTIATDYAYSQVPAKGLTEAGIVKLTDGKVCFDPSGKEKPTRCYTESVRAADGSFTATDEKGVVENVKPVAK
jgi:phosphoglucomutase